MKPIIGEEPQPEPGDEPFRLPESFSEPWQDAHGHWWVTRSSGCLVWVEGIDGGLPPEGHDVRRVVT